MTRLKNLTARYKLFNRLIDEAGSTFLSVEFTKKNGEKRLMNIGAAPVEVRKVTGISGSAKTGIVRSGIVQPRHPNLRTIWDVQADDFRNINFDTITAITTRGMRIEFKEPASATA